MRSEARNASTSTVLAVKEDGVRCVFGIALRASQRVVDKIRVRASQPHGHEGE